MKLLTISYIKERCYAYKTYTKILTSSYSKSQHIAVHDFETTPQTCCKRTWEQLKVKLKNK